MCLLIRVGRILQFTVERLMEQLLHKEILPSHSQLQPLEPTIHLGIQALVAELPRIAVQQPFSAQVVHQEEVVEQAGLVVQTPPPLEVRQLQPRMQRQQ